MRLFVAASLFALLAAPVIAHAAPPGAFKHVIILFQENRTPDNLFGANPHFEKGVDIATSGVNSMGQTIPLTPEPLAGCYDPSHAHSAFEDELTIGFDHEPIQDPAGCTLPANPIFKYTDNSTLTVQPYFDIATAYSFANRMFQTNQGPSFPAHQFIFGGTSSPTPDTSLFVSGNMGIQNVNAGCVAPPNQLVNVIDGTGSETSNPPIYPCMEHNTMGDVLDAAGISWRYYTPTSGGIWAAPNAIQHICRPEMVSGVLQCTGKDWQNGSVSAQNGSQVLTDIQKCDLAAVSWVIPTGANSDHASVTDGTGPQWVADVLNQVGENPACSNGEVYWRDTAVIITWDDWGGWFDHVTPPLIQLQPTSPPAWGDGYTYGYRVPMMIASAYTKAGYVDNRVHDFGSILYFIEQNFGLGQIGPATDLYTVYADGQEARRHDALKEFFGLSTPRPYTPIAVQLPASYFKALPPSDVPVDDDQ